MKLAGWRGILAVAFVVRVGVAFGWLRSMPLVSDAQDYAEEARRLALGSASAPLGDAAFYWPPGNSLVLATIYAAFGDSLWVTRGVMLFLSVVTVALIMLLSRELDARRDARTERASGWLAALYVPAVLLVGQSYAQHLAAMCLVGLAYFALRAMREGRIGYFAVAGIAFGLGCLTRPSMASAAPVLLVAWALELRAKRIARSKLALGAALFVVVASALLVPVVRHNAAHGAGVTLSTNNERNFFLGNNPYTPDYKTSHLGQRSLDELDPETREYLTSFTTRESMQHEAVSYMAHHPAVTAYRTFNRATSFWGFDYLASRIIQEARGWGKRGLLPLLALEAGSYIATMVLAIAGVLAFGAPRAPAGDGDEPPADAVVDPFYRRWLVWLAFAYELPYMLAFSGGTYHFPALGLLLPFAGVAAARWREWWPRVRSSRPTMIAVAAFFAIQVQYAYFSIAMSS